MRSLVVAVRGAIAGPGAPYGCAQRQHRRESDARENRFHDGDHDAVQAARRASSSCLIAGEYVLESELRGFGAAGYPSLPTMPGLDPVVALGALFDAERAARDAHDDLGQLGQQDPARGCFQRSSGRAARPSPSTTKTRSRPPPQVSGRAFLGELDGARVGRPPRRHLGMRRSRSEASAAGEALSEARVRALQRRGARRRAGPMRWRGSPRATRALAELPHSSWPKCPSPAVTWKPRRASSRTAIPTRWLRPSRRSSGDSMAIRRPCLSSSLSRRTRAGWTWKTKGEPRGTPASVSL